jgi:quinol monooxygenase YgiN
MLALALSVVAVLPSVAGAQDPVPIYPANYRVLIENEQVRVMDFRLRKGDTEDFHELKTPAARQAVRGGDAKLADVLTAVTFIQGREGKGSEVKRELLSLTAPTRAEPGSITYDLYQSVDRPDRFMRIEVWRDSEALELHKATPHLKASFEHRKDAGWMTEITRWERVPEERGEQRAALAR